MSTKAETISVVSGLPAATPILLSGLFCDLEGEAQKDLNSKPEPNQPPTSSKFTQMLGMIQELEPTFLTKEHSKRGYFWYLMKEDESDPGIFLGVDKRADIKQAGPFMRITCGPPFKSLLTEKFFDDTVAWITCSVEEPVDEESDEEDDDLSEEYESESESEGNLSESESEEEPEPVKKKSPKKVTVEKGQIIEKTSKIKHSKKH